MLSLQTVIVILIVGAAAFFLLRRVRKSLNRSTPPSCGCGCSACSATQCGTDDQPGPDRN